MKASENIVPAIRFCSSDTWWKLKMLKKLFWEGGEGGREGEREREGGISYHIGIIGDGLAPLTGVRC